MDRENGRRRRNTTLSAGILAGSLLVSAASSGCGQRGPLYLPTPPAEPPARIDAPVPGPTLTPAPALPRTGAATPPAGGVVSDPSAPRRTD
jgi:predicted small lipoprotein YifL